MNRERVLLFTGVVLALLLIPTVLPYLLGGILLPIWAYLMYASIVLVNAALYLMNRCILIDRYLVPRRPLSFWGWNFLLLVTALGIQVLTVWTMEGLMTGGTGLGEILNIPTRIAQGTLAVVLGILCILGAIAVSFSDKWRLAAFRYNESVKDRHEMEKDIDRLKDQVDALKRRQASSEREPESISVKINLVMTRIPFDDILYVKSDGDYIVIHKTDGETPMTLMTLKALEKQLPFTRFCRVHRSYLVNVDQVRGIQDGKLLIGKDRLPLSDSCKPAFFELLSHKSIVLKAE